MNALPVRALRAAASHCRRPPLHRPLATVSSSTSTSSPTLSDALPATLHLKTGHKFTGRAFGAPQTAFGETVFSTSVTSYTESMTDPSYRSQILVFTQPLIGNYGVPHNARTPDGVEPPVTLESAGVQCAGVIVADLAERFSHYQAVESLSQWCLRHNVPGITGVDTRAITTLLRNHGSTLGKLAVGQGHDTSPEADEYFDPCQLNLVDQVSTKEPYTLNEGGDVKIAVLDFGSKANILRCLIRRGAAVTVLPWDFDFNSVRDQFDGLFLSNGPGDPSHCMSAALNVRKTINEWDKPVFGICMGNQIIGLAAGLEAYRMRFGNRGHNQPVLAVASQGTIKAGRVYISSQNHGEKSSLSPFLPYAPPPFPLSAYTRPLRGG